MNRGETNRVSDFAHYGEVTFALPRALGDSWWPPEMMDVAAGADETIGETRYLVDVDAWLIGLPLSRAVRDFDGTPLRQERFYYDGEGYTGLPFGMATDGLVTRHEKLLMSASRWVNVERAAYSEHGRPVGYLDAVGNRRELAYDPETATFVTTETIEVESGWLAAQAEYDTAYGVMTRATDFNGQTTSYSYDGLGWRRSPAGQRIVRDLRCFRHIRSS